MTGRARDMILDPDQTDRLREVIAEGEYYGMQTFDQALLSHYQAGRVSMEDALRVASSPHDFKLLVAGEGRTSTSMNDLSAAERAGSHDPEPPAPAAPSAPAAPTAPTTPPVHATPPVQHARPVAPVGAPNGRPSSPPPGMAA